MATATASAKPANDMLPAISTSLVVNTTHFPNRQVTLPEPVWTLQNRENPLPLPRIQHRMLGRSARNLVVGPT